MSQAADTDVQSVPSQLRTCLWGKRWRADILGVLAVLVIVLVFGHRLLGSRISMPEDIVSTLSPWNAIAPLKGHNGILHDVPLTVYPNRSLINNEIQKGHFPLWDPYSEIGQPAAGDPNIGIFYPITIALSWLSPGHALNVEMLIHLLAVTLGMYVLVRLWGGHPFGAVAAAAAFAGCAPLTVWQQYGILYNVEAWLPWIVVCYVLAGRGRRFLWLGIGSLVTGLLAVENVLQWTIYELLFLGCYALFLAVQCIPTRDWRRISRPVTDAAIIAALGIGIGMIQSIPFTELALHSPRADLRGYAYLRANVAPPQQLLTLLAPNFFGTPTVGFSLWGQSAIGNGGFYAENTIFFGLFPMLIALFAPLWRRTRLVWSLWAFMLAMASFVYGSLTIHLLAVLPAFDRFKPIRMSYLLCFSGAVLCGIVFSHLVADRQRWRPLVAIGGGALVSRAILHLALLHYQSGLPKVTAPTQESVRWVTWMVVGALVVFGGAIVVRSSIMRPIASAALMLLIVVDIAHFNIPYNEATFDANAIFPTPTVIAALPRSAAPPRVAAINQPDAGTLFSPNTLSPYGVSDLGAHGSLLLGSYLDYMTHVEHRDQSANSTFVVVHNAASPLLDLAGAEYFFSNVPLNRDGLDLVTNAQYVYLYHNRHAQRAFIVTNVTSSTDRANLWQTLDAPGFTACSVAVVRTNVPLASSGQPGCVGTATITHYEPNRVDIHAETPVDGLLVFNDTYYPGWHVTVDGQSQPLYETDGEFRGVHLSAGAHDVRFVYRPASVLWGAGLTIVSFLCALALIVVGVSRRGASRHGTVGHPFRASAAPSSGLTPMLR